MGLEHAVLGAEMAVAEAAVANDELGGFPALLEVASRLASRHCEGGERREDGGRCGMRRR